MGSLRCDVCLGEEGRVAASPILPPLLYKHLGLMVCGEVVSCGGCSQLLQLWDDFSVQAVHNLAITHPTARSEPPLQRVRTQPVEESLARVAALLGPDWNPEMSAQCLANLAHAHSWERAQGESLSALLQGWERAQQTQVPQTQVQVPQQAPQGEQLPTVAVLPLQAKQEVFGCVEANSQQLEDDWHEEEEAREAGVFVDCNAGMDSDASSYEAPEPPRQLQVKLEAPSAQAQMPSMPLRLRSSMRKPNLRHKRKTKIAGVANTVLCPKCNIKFSSHQYLLCHIMQYHTEIQGRDFVCIFCSQILRSKQSLLYHTRKHFNKYLNLKCKFCPKHLSSRQILECHTQSHHPTTLAHETKSKFDHTQFNFICPFCYKGLSSKINLELHIKACKDNSRSHINYGSINSDSKFSKILEYTCEFCYRVLTSEEKLQHHFYRCHHEISLQGNINYSNLDLGLPSVSCEFCNTNLVSKVFLEYHVKRWHDGATSESKSQTTPVTKKKHSKQCNFCNRILSSNQMLRYHIQNQHCEFNTKSKNIGTSKRASKNPLTYTCNFCHRIICSKQGLQKHILNYHSGSNQDSKYPCNFCSNGFETKVGLVQHMRHHPRMEPRHLATAPAPPQSQNMIIKQEVIDEEMLPDSVTIKPEPCPLNIITNEQEAENSKSLKIKFSNTSGNFSCKFTEKKSKKKKEDVVLNTNVKVADGKNFINCSSNDLDSKTFTCSFCDKVLLSKLSIELHMKESHIIM